MKRALVLVALAACGGNRKPMSVNCEMEESGKEIPSLLQNKPWLLHDLKVASRLPRNMSCVIRGRTREEVWSEEPGMKTKTDPDDGIAHIIFKSTDFSPGQTELVIKWSDGSAKVPLPALPQIAVGVETDGGGVAHITGTVEGADSVKLAGEVVPVTKGELAVDIKLASWVFEHATVADLPLDPLPGTLTMLIEAGEGEARSHAMATMPAPVEMLTAWLQGVLAEGATVPYAPPADFAKDARPMVVVFWEADADTGDEVPVLKSLARDTKIGQVEAVAHVRIRESKGKCGPRSDRVVTLYSASDGVQLARESFQGKEADPCDAGASAPPDELEITAWLSANASPLPKPKASRPKGR